jgi:hypothetical protein
MEGAACFIYKITRRHNPEHQNLAEISCFWAEIRTQDLAKRRTQRPTSATCYSSNRTRPGSFRAARQRLHASPGNRPLRHEASSTPGTSSHGASSDGRLCPVYSGSHYIDAFPGSKLTRLPKSGTNFLPVL